MDEQVLQLSRVRTVIGELVKDFCLDRLGSEFRMQDLVNFVNCRLTHIAPGSADRILRDLRQRGEVNYECIEKQGSLYRVIEVR